MIRLFVAAILFASCILFPGVTTAQEIPSIIQDERMEAVVENILSEKQIDVFGKQQTVQELELKFTSGSLTKQSLIIKNGELPALQQTFYKPGDKIVVSVSKNLDGQNVYIISDFVRRDAILWLLGIFIFVTLFVGGKKGLFSILGLIFSFFVIFVFILPKILTGSSPTMIATIGSAFILPLNFYLSHGINKKTSIAIVSTFLALGFTGFLANIFISSAHLTGYASDEATFLQVAKQGTMNMQGLLLAGIIIGLLGILDDVTVAQAAIVFELKKASDKLGFLDLYKKAMNVGKDHIASVVNTLILVYAGAALPLLLLFINNPLPFSQVINFEMISEEIVRTLVASIGLILSIPLTTGLSAWIATKRFMASSVWFAVFLLLTISYFPRTTHAIVDPTATSNNRFGIHVVSPISQVINESVELVNSQGGDWGYITVVMEDKEQDVDKWQQFFNELRAKHLIPIIRLATHPQKDTWALPSDDLDQKWANFLDQLNWPVKNRYIVIYNEPNHATEWGGTVNPASYAKFLDRTITSLKNKNPDFFVLNAGLDVSAPEQSPNYKDSLEFMKIMDQTIPGIFEKLDGWVSHSYPNPGFVGLPQDFGRGTVRTWIWELDVLKNLGVKKNLPIFITETGWKHSQGINTISSLPNPQRVAKYYQQAFEGAWNSKQIIAVTPFILNYQQSPFDHFSFKKITGEKQDSDFYEQYTAIKNLPKAAGKPAQYIKAQLTQGEVYTSIVAGQNYKVQLVFKNTGQTIWNSDQVTLKALRGGSELGIVITEETPNKEIEPGQEQTYRLEFRAPKAGTYKVVLNLFQGDNQFENSVIEFETEVKSPVILQIKSSLKWKENFAGQYLLSVVGPISETLSFILTKDGLSQKTETRELLPDYAYNFTLTKPFYKPKTITQTLSPGINVLDFGIIEPDFVSVIFNPKELWKLLPWSQ